MQCPQCRKRLKKGFFTVISGGGLEGTPKNANMLKKGVGFLYLTRHEDENCKHLVLADECPNGQFEIYFCSTECFRKWINKRIDHLEKPWSCDSNRC